MTENNSLENTSNISLPLNYINLLNNLLLSLNKSPIKSLQELSNESFIYSLILEIEPKFLNIPLNNSVEINISEDINIRTNNFISIFSSVEKYCNESKIRDNFTKETKFYEIISIKDLLNNDIKQLMKISEMLIFLTIISSNKNNYIEKMNKIDENTISKLYYGIIEKYICFKIDDSNIIINANNNNDDINNNINNDKEINENKNNILNQKLNIKTVKAIKINKDNFNLNSLKLFNDDLDNINNINNIENTNIEQQKEEKEDISQLKEKFNCQLIIQKQENIFNKSISLNNTQLNNDLIENLKNEIESLHKIIDDLNIENQELKNSLEKSNSRIKEIELDYQKLKEELELKEQNLLSIISNNKSTIEKLNHDLKLEIKLNQKMTEEKDIFLQEIKKYKENDINNININNNEIQILKQNLEDKNEQIKKLKDKNILYEKEEEEFNYYKKSYEEQKIRVNEEHKLISESLYKLAIHFMTLKDDLQSRINTAKKNQ